MNYNITNFGAFTTGSTFSLLAIGGCHLQPFHTQMASTFILGIIGGIGGIVAKIIFNKFSKK
jgi:hypothetical protein